MLRYSYKRTGHRRRLSSYALVTRSNRADESPSPCVFRGVRQQSYVPGAFDCHRQPTLMLGAGSCLASRFDLAMLGDEVPQQIDILVVNRADLVDTEGTNLAAATSSGTSATTPIPPASPPIGTARPRPRRPAAGARRPCAPGCRWPIPALGTRRLPARRGLLIYRLMFVLYQKNLHTYHRGRATAIMSLRNWTQKRRPTPRSCERTGGAGELPSTQNRARSRECYRVAVSLPSARNTLPGIDEWDTQAYASPMDQSSRLLHPGP